MAEAGAPPAGARRGRHPALGETDLAADKKNAQKLKATLVFLDESGFSLLPTPCKTWAPRGRTPLLLHCFHWPKLSAISAGTPNPQAFRRLVRGTIRSAELIAFLRHLLRWIPGPLFLLWDGLNTHRSKKTRAALREHCQRLRVYPLPAYAPELNPDEGFWGWRKHYALAGQCPPIWSGWKTAFAWPCAGGEDGPR